MSRIYAENLVVHPERMQSGIYFYDMEPVQELPWKDLVHATVECIGDDETFEVRKLTLTADDAEPETYEIIKKWFMSDIKYPPRYSHPCPGIGFKPESIGAVFAAMNLMFGLHQSPWDKNGPIRIEGEIVPDPYGGKGFDPDAIY